MSRGRSRAAASSPLSTPDTELSNNGKFTALWRDMVNSIRTAHEKGSSITTVEEFSQENIAKLRLEATQRENEEKHLRQALERVTQLIVLKEDEQQRILDEQPLKKRKVKKTPNDIKVGSQVAFRINNNDNTSAKPPFAVGEEEWIQCEVTKVLIDGSKYEVQDPEPDENNNPGQRYKASIKDLILIPNNSNLLTPLHASSQVLARYPETTTFYRAEVISSSKHKCRLIFEGEEEEGKETEVERRLVLPVPK